MVDLKRVVRRHWDINGLIADLRNSDFEMVASEDRMERRTYLASERAIQMLAKNVVSKKEWKEAVKNGVEQEISDEYLQALVDVIKGSIRGPSRHDNISYEWHDGDAFIVQSADIEELKKAGVLDWNPEE